VTATPRPAHFLLTPVGSSGDVHPFIGIGRALRQRGHDVTIVTSGLFRADAEREGLRVVEAQSSEDFDRLTRHPDLWHSRRGLLVVMQAVVSALRGHYDFIARAYEPGRTVLVGHMLSLSTRVFQEVHDAPAATLHLAPSAFRSDDQQPVFDTRFDVSGWPVWMKRSIWRLVDALADRQLLPELNGFRRELGLAPVSRVFKDWVHSPARLIGLFPEWFAPAQRDWPGQLRLTGFPLYDASNAPEPSASVQAFLDRGTPPIVFTPGSANRAAAAFFAAAVDATRRLGRRAIFLTKYREQVPASLGDDIWYEP